MSGARASSNPFNVHTHTFEELTQLDEIDEHFGFGRYTEGTARTGWLSNMHPTLVKDPEWSGGRSAVDFYFLEESGGYFKATLVTSAYLFVICKEHCEIEAEEFLKKKFESLIEKIDICLKEDLDLPNHLTGLKRPALKVHFRNVNDLAAFKKSLAPIIAKNKEGHKINADYEHLQASKDRRTKESHPSEVILELREHDLPFHLRTSIDFGIRVGLWYSVKPIAGNVVIELVAEKHVRPDPVVLAFDIETTKAPLKFPDAAFDQVMMISYMIDGDGFLIVNREIVAEDIDDFEYTPKPEYPGTFTIFNEPNEKGLLVRFFRHIHTSRPTIFVTYNGDFFDWPFVEKRAAANDLDMFKSIGFSCENQEEYRSRYASHMDAFKWVKRDSYLPAGSHGLKAVTAAKLGYNPIELDPELMLEYAQNQPQVLASYSVSDAVATYYLYMKYVHPFIFSLCNIIPLNPDDVLRKGSGTLCETLLMAEAYKANIIMPNKSVAETNKFHDGHLLESETYVGGHVEALESGVFRSDIPTNFALSAAVLQNLIEDLDRALKFTIEVENNMQLREVLNYEEILGAIAASLRSLQETPIRKEHPLIFHLDVAAMYPNIILTNRLQPPAIVNEAICAACDFNKPGKQCQRTMSWSWRGEFYTAKKNEYKMIVNQLESERFNNAYGRQQSFHELPYAERNALIQKRLSQYCRKVYKKIHDSEVVVRESIVCQKENSFYVDTVRNFRDRRYDYKNLHKVWKKKLDDAVATFDSARIDEAKKMNVIYDSLQLAHKCILNSFYGYVMRKGARWYSMEMAGIVCETGSNIIQMARKLVEKVGRPLELDTDGIWCILPKSFPDKFEFVLKSGKRLQISYPCVMLNHLVHDKFTNPQYHQLQPTDNNQLQYAVRAENSIFFEIDGPYHAMILPASKEENKLLKKRYAVFNFNGSLAELKGFEIKRRGELKLIKIFQSQIFKLFLEGGSLQESYGAAAAMADYWLDILHSKGEKLNTAELFDLISENRSMSKSLEEYGQQKSTSISTAKRLSEFLGDEMIKDKGLSCRYIISARPYGDPVASRAIPLAIFSSEEPVKEHYLRKWLKDPSITNFDIRTILDWTYYLERLESVIQKIITIPAAMQGVANPVPRVKQPDWVCRRMKTGFSASMSQMKLTDVFGFSEQPFESRPVDVAADAPCEKVTETAKEAVDTTNYAYLLRKNYREYVAACRTKWRRLAKNAKTMPVKPLGSGQMFTAALNSLQLDPWYVLGVVPTETPGIFKFVIYQNNIIHQINVSVPRTFYINSRVPDIYPGLQQVYCKLPRSFKSYYLYEFTADEGTIASDINIEEFKCHPDVDSIYESKVPLIVRPLINVGTCCRLSPKSSFVFGTNSILDLSDIVYLNEATARLSVPTVKDVFSLFYVYEIGDAALERYFFAIIFGAKCFVIVVESTGVKSVPPIAPLLAGHQSNFFALEDVEVQTLSFRSLTPALKAIRKCFSELRSASMKNIFYVTTLQHRLDTSFLNGVAPLASIKLDGFAPLPSLDWQRAAMRRFATALTLFDDVFTQLEAISKYAYIPIVNLADAEDPAKFVTDIVLARTLKDNEHILWYDASDGVDLGGHEQDWYVNDSKDQFENFVISNAGCYRNVSFEIDISNLYLNTLLVTPRINELEGSAFDDGFDDSSFKVNSLIEKRIVRNIELNVALSDNQYSKSFFQILRHVVTNWYREAVVDSSSYAFTLLKTFDTWLTTKQSALHDALIVNRVKILSKKVILQLIHTLKEYGAEVVFSSYDRIIISSRKNDFESATEWINFLLQKLKENDLFLWLNMHVRSGFRNLLWADATNYAGFLSDESVSGRFSLLSSFSEPEISTIFINLVGEYLQKIAACADADDSMHANYSVKVFDFLKQVTNIYSTSVAVDLCRRFLKVVGVDSQLAEYHQSLQRNCFLLLGQSEFAGDAEMAVGGSFGAMYTVCINDFCCPACLNLSSVLISATKESFCMHCGISQGLEKHLENHIIQLLNGDLCKYFTQDLICVKCRQTKVAACSSYCKCSGEYAVADISSEYFRATVAIVATYAKRFGLRRLERFVAVHFA